MLFPWKGRWALLTVLFSFACFSQDRIQSCADCHGEDGNSTDPQIPSIAGQPKLFLENQLILYREEVRKSSEMLPVAKGLKDSEIIKLAEHFSKLPAKGMESGTPEKGLLQRGSQRAKELRCGICHLADFRGQNQIPRLAGQREAYLEAEMRAYRDSKRTGGDTIMAAALYRVSDADIKALAHFLSRSNVRSPGR
jgi:cytochrome c553